LYSRKGETRANHWHEKDWHYLYTVSGLLKYEEWPSGKSHHLAQLVAGGPHASDCAQETETTILLVGPGQMIFTPPNRAHRLLFLEDTVMISISKLSRRHAEHEADVVRL
jgi:quercetin dioxygenase-like cupin family protein